jgi:hypothetical protein
MHLPLASATMRPLRPVISATACWPPSSWMSCMCSQEHIATGAKIALCAALVCTDNIAPVDEQVVVAPGPESWEAAQVPRGTASAACPALQCIAVPQCLVLPASEGLQDLSVHSRSCSLTAQSSRQCAHMHTRALGSWYMDSAHLDFHQHPASLGTDPSQTAPASAA